MEDEYHPVSWHAANNREPIDCGIEKFKAMAFYNKGSHLTSKGLYWYLFEKYDFTQANPDRITRTIVAIKCLNIEPDPIYSMTSLKGYLQRCLRLNFD